MRKKGDVEAGFIAPILMVIVLVVGAILVYEFFISKSSITRTLSDFIDKYRYPVEWGSYQFLKEKVNGILTGCTNMEDLSSSTADDIANRKAAINSQASKWSSLIETQIIKLDKTKASMLDRFTKLNAEVKADAGFCFAQIDFANAKFDGVDEKGFLSKMDAAKAGFNKISTSPEFSVSAMIKDKIALIDKIKGCDFSSKEIEAQCTAENTNYYCISYIERNLIINRDLGHWVCKKTLCSAAKSDQQYCTEIAAQTVASRVCYAKAKLNENGEGSFDFCIPCLEIKSCSDYGLDPNSCNMDACNKELSCEYPYPYLTGGCREKGAGKICADFQTPESCASQGCSWGGVQGCMELAVIPGVSEQG